MGNKECFQNSVWGDKQLLLIIVADFFSAMETMGYYGICNMTCLWDVNFIPFLMQTCKFLLFLQMAI